MIIIYGDPLPPPQPSIILIYCLRTKTVENRLFDEKRREFLIGDKLIFISNDTREKIHATIIGLHRASSFKALFGLAETRGKYSTLNIDELLAGTALHYTPQQEKQYGVVGIEFILNL